MLALNEKPKFRLINPTPLIVSYSLEFKNKKEGKKRFAAYGSKSLMMSKRFGGEGSRYMLIIM